jgi:O-antigen ligase
MIFALCPSSKRDRMNSTGIGEQHRRELPEPGDSALLYGAIGLLLFGPLAFGAVEPWSMLVLEAGSAGLLLCWIAKQVVAGEIKFRNNPLFLPMVTFAVLIAAQVGFRLSAYSHATMSTGLLYIAYGILCFLVAQSLVRASQARKLAAIFCVYGAVVAWFALIQGVSSNGKLYWLREPRMGGWIYGPYVNHNHYAGLMEMLVPIPLVMSLAHFGSPKSRNLAAAAAAVMVGTIFLSGSRGGMLAMVTELAILAVVVMKQKHGGRTAISLGLFLAIAVSLLVWIGGTALSQRIASAAPTHSELSNDIRMLINRDGLSMFRKRPLLGWGLGTFPVVYPQFRTFYTNFFVNQAHNDYLQLLVETGLMGFAAMVWFLVMVYKQGIKKIGSWNSEINGAVSLACLLGLSGILVHGAVDFNLQIPANAALFYVLCTIAASKPFAKPVRKHRQVHSQAQEPLLAEEALQQPVNL